MKLMMKARSGGNLEDLIETETDETELTESTF